MSDRDDEPTDLFDVVRRVDDITEWLAEAGYPDAAAALDVVSDSLKAYIVISVRRNAQTNR